MVDANQVAHRVVMKLAAHPEAIRRSDQEPSTIGGVGLAGEIGMFDEDDVAPLVACRTHHGVGERVELDQTALAVRKYMRHAAR